MKKIALIATASLLVSLPFAAGAAMNGPDPNVNGSWQVQVTATVPNNGANDPGAYGGTLDFKGTITDVNAAARTFAVNGRWVDPQRWITLAQAAGFQVTGIDPNVLRSAWENLTVGDKVQLKAELAPNGIRVTNWQLIKAVNSAARAQLQARLQQLLQQVNVLMQQLRSQGVQIGGPNATTTTSTNP